MSSTEDHRALAEKLSGLQFALAAGDTSMVAAIGATFADQKAEQVLAERAGIPRQIASMAALQISGLPADEGRASSRITGSRWHAFTGAERRAMIRLGCWRNAAMVAFYADHRRTVNGSVS